MQPTSCEQLEELPLVALEGIGGELDLEDR